MTIMKMSKFNPELEKSIEVTYGEKYSIKKRYHLSVNFWFIKESDIIILNQEAGYYYYLQIKVPHDPS